MGGEAANAISVSVPALAYGLQILQAALELYNTHERTGEKNWKRIIS